ncbi:hypothetical protein [Pseudomonas citronellolis]|uniref:hypothetical protein n=1 Tax=Pseudomonas citronellolis TaxID=53408 RepID=UPI003C2FBC31
MALKKCKECKKDVSSKAKTCPHCGISNPGTSAKDMVAGVLLLLFIGWAAVQCTSKSKDGGSPPEPEKPKISDTDCKKDLQCWGDKHLISASVACQGQVERLAKYSFKWTDGTFEPKFSRFRWTNQDKGFVTYVGDKIQLQNGFGAFQNYIYECDFDPATKAVLDVRASPGRI